MTVTTPATTTAVMPVTLRATSPIHHGAGTSGNTAVLRMQEQIHPELGSVRTPMVSGNSLRHAIRSELAWQVATAVGIPDGSLSKACVDLLWSGGALASGSAQTDLTLMRERHDLLWQLGLLGYSHGPDIVTGTLRMSHAHLWCTENAWRLPPVAAAPLLPGLEWVDEEFGTRHDVTATSVDRLLDAGAPASSSQMIYDWQVVKTGSVWCFEVAVQAAVPQHVSALVAALSALTKDGGWPLAAKTATGHGRTQVIDMDLTRLTPDPAAAADAWADHLAARAGDIRAFLASL